MSNILLTLRVNIGLITRRNSGNSSTQVMHYPPNVPQWESECLAVRVFAPINLHLTYPAPTLHLW